MNCKDWEERIALYAEGDLPQADWTPAERHLAECTACRQFLAELKESLATLRAAHAEPLEASALTAVRARVFEQIDHAGRRTWRLVWISALAATGVALVTLLLPRPVPRPKMVAAPQVQVVTTPPAPVMSPRTKPVFRRKKRTAPRNEPLIVKLITDDPDVVIYWITD